MGLFRLARNKIKQVSETPLLCITETANFMKSNINNNILLYFFPCRHDWYQNETHVIITVLAKNVKSDCVTIEFQEKNVSCELLFRSKSTTTIGFDN